MKSSWRFPLPPVLTAAALCALILVGCSSDGSATSGAGDPDAATSGEVTGDAADLVADGAVVVVANSAGAISTNGPQRVMVALLGDGPNRFLGGADTSATIEFRSEDGSVTDEVAGRWLSTEGVDLGLYVAHYTFTTDGLWEVRVKGADGSPAFINVATDSSVPEPGDPAPPSQTLTAASAGSLEAISTDPDPDPALYELSVAEAVSSGAPSVIVFSTPAFCQTAICGPTVEIVKGVATEHPEVHFVHVEPWDIEQARAGTLVPIDAMIDWNLPTEPWIFVVDADGLIRASFEGIIGAEELDEAIAAL